LNHIREWLSSGSVDAKSLVDFPWDVSVTGDCSIKAVYPKFPIGIDIVCDDRLGFLRLSITLETETLTLEKDEKILVYHKFLRRNTMPMVKYALTGDESIPTLIVDLSIKSLSKEEFNDALALLLAATNDSIKALGLEEYYKERMFTQLLELVQKYVEQGWGRERLYEYLTKYAGLKEEEAEQLLRSMFETKGKPDVYI